MRGADHEMLGDEVDEEHEQTAGDEAGVEVPLRRALLALPGLHLAAAHGNFLLPPCAQLCAAAGFACLLASEAAGFCYALLQPCYLALIYAALEANLVGGNLVCKWLLTTPSKLQHL